MSVFVFARECRIVDELECMKQIKCSIVNIHCIPKNPAIYSINVKNFIFVCNAVCESTVQKINQNDRGCWSLHLCILHVSFYDVKMARLK